MSTARLPSLLVVCPTAQRPPPGMRAMLERPLSARLWLGLGVSTTDQVPCTPCSTSVLWLPVLGSMSQPTAQVDPSRAVAAAKRSFSPAPTLGVVTGLMGLLLPSATNVV